MRELIQDGVHVSQDRSTTHSIVESGIQAKRLLVQGHIDLDPWFTRNGEDVGHDHRSERRNHGTIEICLVWLEMWLKRLDKAENLLP